MVSSASSVGSVQRALVRAVTSTPSMVFAAVVALVSLYPFIFTWDSHRQFFFDLTVYFGALKNWAETGDLYNWALPPDNIYGFTYPPFALLAFTPLLVFPSATVAGPFVLLGNVLVMVLVMMLSQRAMGVAFRMRLALSLWLVPLALMLFPVRMNMIMGQTNLVLLLLILADGVLLSGTRFSGILSAVAASIKMTPALFIIYFIAKRDWGAVLRFVGTGLACIGISLLVVPRITVEFFADKIFESNRVGSIVEPLSYNLLGEFARLFQPSVTTVLFPISIIIVGTIAYLSARAAWSQRQNLMALCTIGFLTLLVSPISWNHHWVWIIPALTVCLALGIKKADATYLFMFASGAILFTLHFESWFSGNKWDVAQWPVYAVLMHMLPTVWSIVFLALPYFRERRGHKTPVAE